MAYLSPSVAYNTKLIRAAGLLQAQNRGPGPAAARDLVTPSVGPLHVSGPSEIVMIAGVGIVGLFVAMMVGRKLKRAS